MKQETAYGIIPFFRTDKGIEYLLVHHHAGHWGFPKGRPDPEETPVLTALRELEEETGLDDVKLFEHEPLEDRYIKTKKGEKIKKCVQLFIGEVQSNHVTIHPDELQDHTWLLYDEALNRLTFKETKDTLIKANEIITQ